MHAVPYIEPVEIRRRLEHVLKIYVHDNNMYAPRARARAV